MFLTEKEVQELTGVIRGSQGLTSHELQATQLRKMGIYFWVNARGLPKIVKESLIGGSKVPEKPVKKKWELTV